MSRQRLSQCNQLIEHLKSDAASADFAVSFKESVAFLEMSNEELADELGVSRPTVTRWIQGKNLPHPGMRRPVLKFVIDKLNTKARILRAHLGEDDTAKQRPSVAAFGSVAAVAKSR